MRTIEQYWNIFEACVIPQRAGPVQRSEMRKAFYAGVATMMEVNQALGSGDYSEDAGVSELEKIELQLSEFIDALSDGNA